MIVQLILLYVIVFQVCVSFGEFRFQTWTKSKVYKNHLLSFLAFKTQMILKNKNVKF